MFFTYFLNVFEIVPFAPVITDITFVFTFHMRCIIIIIIVIIIIIILVLTFNEPKEHVMGKVLSYIRSIYFLIPQPRLFFKRSLSLG